MEFVSYFLDRGHRMAAMSGSLRELMAEKVSLQRQESDLMESYAEVRPSSHRDRGRILAQKASPIATQAGLPLCCPAPNTQASPIGRSDGAVE